MVGLGEKERFCRRRCREEKRERQVLGHWSKSERGFRVNLSFSAGSSSTTSSWKIFLLFPIFLFSEGQ